MRAGDPVEALRQLVAPVVDLRQTVQLLGWDERVNMPAGGVSVRADMVATVQRLAHEAFTSPRMGEAIEAAQQHVADLPAEADEARLVRVMARDYGRAVRVPADFVARHAVIVSKAHEAWREARQLRDFTRFAPRLAEVVALKQEYVRFFQPFEHPYDPLLDEYEPGMRTADVLAIFGDLRIRQIGLARQAAAGAAAVDSFLHASYPEAEMIQFARDVITAFGFDWGRGRQDVSAHPFATPLGSDDVRITTRFDPRQPFETLFSTMHEAGHALYEQGIDPAWARTPARGGASLGVHESQSRLWENIVGRSRPFWDHFFPLLAERFPSQLRGVTVDGFCRAVNRVKPSLIRVEADEVTYNLHVMLRVELEVALLTGQVAIDEAPAWWNARMLEDLGVAPADDADGILQDMHWSIGLFGYFATYTIGNLISAQLWQTFTRLHPGWDAEVRAGEFTTLREWLRQSLHRHGRSRTPRELVEAITGAPVSTGPYLHYLQSKYAA